MHERNNLASDESRVSSRTCHNRLLRCIAKLVHILLVRLSRRLLWLLDSAEQMLAQYFRGWRFELTLTANHVVTLGMLALLGLATLYQH
ncbi:hypothetical protein AB0C24_11295 [Amycolatopsis japonica]|uniref:hypothetical protein n=1 Tax=Amycolatopsis japonica TaxID=208439 RepID=UPI0033C5CDD8